MKTIKTSRLMWRIPLMLLVVFVVTLAITLLACRLQYPERTDSVDLTMKPVFHTRSGDSVYYDSGRELLQGWQTPGAQMTVRSGEDRARIQLVTGIPVTFAGAKPGDAGWLVPRAATLLLAALLALLFAATAVVGNSTLNAARRTRSDGMPTSGGERTLISDFRCVHRGTAW